MVINDGAGWRKDYYQEINRLLLPIWQQESLPESLELPVSSTSCMFEFGGSKYSSGKAMLIATPSGFPNAAIALKNRVSNGLHAASKVWVGCLIGIAHHQFGVTTVGIYKLESMLRTPTERFKSAGKFKLVVGLFKEDTIKAHDVSWVSPYDRKYPGLKKLVHHLLTKLEMYDCTVPVYLEPFRIIYQDRSTEPKFKNLIKNTDLEQMTDQTDLLPKYVKMIKSMAEIKQCDLFSRLEHDLLETCEWYHVTYPFVYALFCHHISNGGLETHAFVCFQKDINKILQFHKTGWLYRHLGVDIEPGQQYMDVDKPNRIVNSYDLNAFIKSNYNSSYLYALLGIRGGGIKKLLTTIEQSRERCIYVPLKYALCLRSYR